MPKQTTDRQAVTELKRARKLVKSAAKSIKRAKKISRILQSEELPDIDTIEAINRRMIQEEKNIAKMLKPVQSLGRTAGRRSLVSRLKPAHRNKR